MSWCNGGGLMAWDRKARGDRRGYYYRSVRVGGSEAVAILPVLENQLAELEGHPLLKGVPLNLTTDAYLREGVRRNVSRDRWVRERVLAIHDGITAGGAPTEPLCDSQGPSGPTVRDGSRPVRKASLGRTLLMEHPAWTDARIVEAAGCGRSTPLFTSWRGAHSGRGIASALSEQDGWQGRGHRLGRNAAWPG